MERTRFFSNDDMHSKLLHLILKHASSGVSLNSFPSFKRSSTFISQRSNTFPGFDGTHPRALIVTSLKMLHSSLQRALMVNFESKFSCRVACFSGLHSVKKYEFVAVEKTFHRKKVEYWLHMKQAAF